ncbi:MAG: conserved transrane protein [Mycobacterium sp.]|nr:conserved transrane protein [Mycobacterium sp.]
MADNAEQAGEVLFSENGASWYWVLAGPFAAAAMFAIQITSGAGVQWVVPLVFLVLVSGFIAVQIKAARIHTSVELTATSLRQGMETIRVDEIVTVYPAPTNGMRSYYDDRVLNRAAGRNKSNALANRAMKKAGLDPAGNPDPPEKPAPAPEPVSAEKWQSARALGELSGVPRGRTGIGLKLTGGRTAQAWARRHAELRAALTPLVESRGTS